MSEANKIFLKVGRSLFYLLLIYLFIVPVIVFLVAGLDVLENVSGFFPLLLVINGSLDSIVSISGGLVAGLFIASFVLFFILRRLIGKKLEFTMGYCWPILLSLVFAVVSVMVVNTYLYSSPSSAWGNWSQEAITKNDPEICVKKVDAYYQRYCLSSAAMETNDVAFCEKINEIEDEEADGAYWADSCKTGLTLMENISKKFCNTEYDYGCVLKVCENELYDVRTEGKTVFPCPDAVESGYLDSYIGGFDKYSKGFAALTDNISLCDLFEGAPNAQEKIERCQASVYAEEAKAKSDVALCDKISDDYDWSTDLEETCLSL
ncbi:MAG: hypothetical protein WCW30_02850 [Candidatus Gracilibacteria bacterium]|jgi:hypothetical protein